MAYTQIVYISRSTFTPNPATNGIEPNVARILTKSRVNNRKNGLVGVLYFGDGCFFQCLEGEEGAVDRLYQTLLHDERHTDIKLLSKKTIEELSFADWSMKYVPLEEDMNRLLVANGYKSFNPYMFSTHMIEKVLELLFASND
ncbi:MAG: BLUF domain-containing protein, partial [Methylophilaceae bacterium]|nr:BLUF domain-containing protein [Methylophilaceae bacterium]